MECARRACQRSIAAVAQPKGHEARTAGRPYAARHVAACIAMGLGRARRYQGAGYFPRSDASDWITGAVIPMDGGNQAMSAGRLLASAGRRAAQQPPFAPSVLVMARSLLDVVIPVLVAHLLQWRAQSCC